MTFKKPNRRSRFVALASVLLLGGCAQIPWSAPAGSRAQNYPADWHLYGMNAAHRATWTQGAAQAPAWAVALPGAVPKHATKAWIKHRYVSITAVRDLVGVPVGVAAVRGHIYVPDDNGYLYSVDALSGHLEWRFNAHNQIMTTPLVAGRGSDALVYVGGGNSTFSYSQAVRFGQPGAMVSRGTDISGIYAINAHTGKLVWSYHTKGEDMPTPAYWHGRIVFGNGDGHVYALNARSGKLLWKTRIRSFVSMSSATRYHHLIVMAGTHPNAVYALDARTGKRVWKTVPENVFSSSMGDCAPAQQGGVVVTQYETRASGQKRAASMELGLDARTGRVLWDTRLGEGRVPPRNKDAVPMIAHGVIYSGSPVTASAYALDLHSGRVLWHTPLKVKMKAAPSVFGSHVLFPVGNGKIFVLDRATGRVEHVYATQHGGFGPQNAVVVNGSLVIGSNFGWLYSVPLQMVMGVAQ